MNGIQLTDVDGIKSHRVIRPGRHHRGQGFPLFGIFATSIRRRRPGGSLLLTFYCGHPVTRCFAPGLANADRQDLYRIAVFGIVVKAHFGDVHHDALAYGVRQNDLLWYHQFRTSFWQERINAWVGLQHVAQPLAVLRGKGLQRQCIALRHRDNLHAANQATPFRWQWIAHRQHTLTDEQNKQAIKQFHTTHDFLSSDATGIA